MEFLPELQVEITSESPDELLWGNSEFDFDKIIFDLDSKIEMLSSMTYAEGKIVLPMINIIQYFAERNTPKNDE